MIVAFQKTRTFRVYILGDPSSLLAAGEYASGNELLMITLEAGQGKRELSAARWYHASIVARIVF